MFRGPTSRDISPHLLAGRLSEWLVLHGNPFRSVPVIVYQMAKVGSSTIASALRRAGLPVFQVHRMRAEHLAQLRARRHALGWSVPPVPPHDLVGLLLNERLLSKGGRAKVITLVRDPIARNLSSYFEH